MTREDLRLSQHFLLSELVRSDTAARLDIDNWPPEPVIEALRGTAERLEVAREILCEKARREIAILVSSGYRCEALERVLCEKAYAAWCVKNNLMPSRASWKLYFQKKQHPRGTAADWTAPAYGTPLEVCRELAAHAQRLGFDQLIYEFGAWAHTGWGTPPRHQVLTINGSGTFHGLVA